MFRAMRIVMATGVVLVLATAVASGQTVEGQLASYSSENAKGYLGPLNEALGVTLNNGFFYSARIPRDKFRISLELPVMGVLFDDADRTFNASTEGSFQPQQSVSDAPTIVGSGDAVTVSGQGGSAYSFSGGFNLNSFGLTVPQLRLSTKGTEALVRLLVGVDVGDADLGKVNLWGVGARHNISDYFNDLPVDLAGSVFVQSMTLGENSAGGDLIAVSSFSVGLHASKAFPVGFARIEPYAGLMYDSFKSDVSYESSSSASGITDVDFDRENSAHFTLGLGLNLVAAQVFGQYDFALRNSFLFGVALGNVGY